MNKKVKKRKIITAIFILFIFFVWLNNTSLFISHENIGYKFLAHRGLAQTFDESKSAPKNFPGFIWTNRIDIVNPVTTKE